MARRKKFSTTVYLDEDQVIALRALTLTTGVPTAVYVRRAVTALLDQEFEKGTIAASDMAGISVTPLGERHEEKEQGLEATVERVLRRLMGEQQAPVLRLHEKK